MRPKKSPGRPPALNEEMLVRLKGLLETRPYWSLREEKAYKENTIIEGLRRLRRFFLRG
ncbi:helix-turn-helix domain-containing protein [Dehalococcoidia bacterium]|nr:helix-turn-helix domain-containing protein [Dehalococcoidia bacterium]